MSRTAGGWGANSPDVGVCKLVTRLGSGQCLRFLAQGASYETSFFCSSTPVPSAAEQHRRDAHQRRAHHQACRVSALLPAERLRRILREIVFIGMVLEQEKRVE